MRRSYKDEGIVIKKQNIGEADRILTIFTKKHGKVKAFAKGIRKIKSKKAPHLDLLVRSVIFFVSAREFDIVTEAQSIERFDVLKTSLPKSSAGLYLCELVDVLTPEKQELKNIFDLLLEALRAISSVSDDKIPLVLCSFELKILPQLGFWSEDRLKIKKREILMVAQVLQKLTFGDLVSLSIEKELENDLELNCRTLIEEVSERKLKTPRIIKML